MLIRIGRGFWATWIGLALLGTATFLFLLAAGMTTYYWVSYGRMIDLRLSGHIQQTTARIYAAPMKISSGEKMSVAELADHLQRAGPDTEHRIPIAGRLFVCSAEVQGPQRR